jgi:plastocyanin
MKRSLLLAVLLVLPALLLGACGGGDDDDGASGSGDSDGAATPAGPEITIEGSAFHGATSARTGSTLTVRNEDDFEHTFTPDVAGSFAAAELDGGGSAEVELPTAGTFAYHCNIHPSMKGTIEVTA